MKNWSLANIVFLLLVAAAVVVVLMTELYAKHAIDSTLVAVIVTAFGFFIKEYWIDPRKRTEDKLFEQIKINFQRAFFLIQGSNLNANWVASRDLIIEAVKLSKDLKNPGIQQSYKLEEKYYQAKFHVLLKDIPNYKYFFGLPDQVMYDDSKTDKELFDMSSGNVTESKTFGHRRSDENIYYRIDPTILFSFIRFIGKNEECDGKKIGSDIEKQSWDLSPAEEHYFNQFRNVMAYYDVIDLFNTQLNTSSYITLAPQKITGIE